MLLFNELNLKDPIKIYNKYAKYPKIQNIKKQFFMKKAIIYEGKNFSPKIKSKEPLKNEIHHFFKSVKKIKQPLTDYKFSFNLLRFLMKI